MGNFMGGSAYAMVGQIADGYLLVTERTFRRLSPAELSSLTFEIDKKLRSLRGEPAPEETLEVQKRNRRLQRLTSCRRMVAAARQRRR